MRALDLFCGAGGVSMGLHRAGFEVCGVDIRKQPKYPFAFVQGDALAAPFDLREFDLVWASPPCQAFSSLRHLQRVTTGVKAYPNLIPQTREMLIRAGVPWVIENVEGAPLSGNLIRLCGTMFGLQTPDGRGVIRRHRVFETSFSIALYPDCQHQPHVTGILSRAESLSVTGRGLDSNRERYAVRNTFSICGHGSPRVWDRSRSPRRTLTMSVTGGTPQANVEHNRVRSTFSVRDARAAMGIDWMAMKELSQAIPPAYSEFIARSFLGGGA